MYIDIYILISRMWTFDRKRHSNPDASSRKKPADRKQSESNSWPQSRSGIAAYISLSVSLSMCVYLFIYICI